MKFVLDIKDKVLIGYKVNRDDALKLFNGDLEELLNASNEIRDKLCGNKVDLCSIVNGKSGRCSENCAYCAQSKHFKTDFKEYKLLNYKDIYKVAKENQKEGVNRFSIVTSGRGINSQDLEKLIDYYSRLNNECKLKLCASHGIIDKEALIKLKEAGVKRYHHNLETSASYYKEICTTHSYEDRIKTIKAAKKVGLEVCSGGIIGLGESILDRIDLAILLRELEIKSIPINVLMPIKGTSLQNKEVLEEEEILRTIAIFRFINPDADIRLAAGRNLLTNYGESAFKSGANATITGNLLTTCGNKIEDDKKLINTIGLEVI